MGSWQITGPVATLPEDVLRGLTDGVLHKYVEVDWALDTADLPNFARIAISRFEVTPFDSFVAMAPKRSRNFDRIRAELQELRDRGLAE